MADIYFTITGTKYRYGDEFFKKKMKVKLVIMNTIHNRDIKKEIMYFTTEGHIDRWVYSTENGPKLIYTEF